MKYCFDIDGTLCETPSDPDGHNVRYWESEPFPYMIEQVNKLYDMGYTIILYTARYGERRKGNLHEMYGAGYREWTDWLEKYGVKYHHAYMGKPAGVMYIDDKAARVEGDSEEGWGQVWKEIENLKGKDKYGNVIK